MCPLHISNCSDFMNLMLYLQRNDLQQVLLRSSANIHTGSFHRIVRKHRFGREAKACVGGAVQGRKRDMSTARGGERDRGRNLECTSSRCRCICARPACSLLSEFVAGPLATACRTRSMPVGGSHSSRMQPVEVARSHASWSVVFAAVLR